MSTSDQTPQHRNCSLGVMGHLKVCRARMKGWI